jgi:hypothetical protein
LFPEDMRFRNTRTVLGVRASDLPLRRLLHDLVCAGIDPHRCEGGVMSKRRFCSLIGFIIQVHLNPNYYFGS